MLRLKMFVWVDFVVVSYCISLTLNGKINLLLVNYCKGIFYRKFFFAKKLMEMYFILYFIMHIPTNNTVQVFWRSFIYAKFCISWCLAEKKIKWDMLTSSFHFLKNSHSCLAGIPRSANESSFCLGKICVSKTTKSESTVLNKKHIYCTL